MTVLQRSKVAGHFHKTCQYERDKLFGIKDQMPLYLNEDAKIMHSGYVGANYKRGGIVLLAINPGGGGDAYDRRTTEDEKLYPLLQQFSSITDSVQLISIFEHTNETFSKAIKNWNLWRIVSPTLDAANTDLSSIAFLNAVPFRTRGDKMPHKTARINAWKHITGPTLDFLDPAIIVALGKKSGSILNELYAGNAKTFCVPRTIGDSSISPSAREVLDQIAKN